MDAVRTSGAPEESCAFAVIVTGIIWPLGGHRIRAEAMGARVGASVSWTLTASSAELESLPSETIRVSRWLPSESPEIVCAGSGVAGPGATTTVPSARTASPSTQRYVRVPPSKSATSAVSVSDSPSSRFPLEKGAATGGELATETVTVSATTAWPSVTSSVKTCVPRESAGTGLSASGAAPDASTGRKPCSSAAPSSQRYERASPSASDALPAIVVAHCSLLARATSGPASTTGAALGGGYGSTVSPTMCVLGLQNMPLG